jgi:eukaryotic-like serine/threonine-protein kinase
MPDSHAQAKVQRPRPPLPGDQPAQTATVPSQVDRTELPKPGDVIGDKYRVERLLGRGGMGAVFEACHMLSGKRVAVKWMLPAAHHATLAERFMHEARATALIDHPNVVDIYDVGRQGDSVYLVMELLHGESLAARLERAPLPSEEAVPLLMPALRGVAAAHAQGVIHRDLKPENIFLCTGPDGEARDCKVFDFGISKVAADDQRDLDMTRSGIVMGTPYYMSPEQIRGLKEVDERGDVYAFGVILYEILADRYPFDADTYNALIVKIATQNPVPLSTARPDLDPQLSAVVMKAMARDREQRFASVFELAHALLPFAGPGASLHSSTAPSLPRPRPSFPDAVETIRTERQSPWLAALTRPTLAVAASALMVLVAATINWLAQDAQDDGEHAQALPTGPDEPQRAARKPASEHSAAAYAGRDMQIRTERLALSETRTAQAVEPTAVAASAHAPVPQAAHAALEPLERLDQATASEPSKVRKRSRARPRGTTGSSPRQAQRGRDPEANSLYLSRGPRLVSDWDERMPTALPSKSSRDTDKSASKQAANAAGQLSDADL